MSNLNSSTKTNSNLVRKKSFEKGHELFTLVWGRTSNTHTPTLSHSLSVCLSLILTGTISPLDYRSFCPANPSHKNRIYPGNEVQSFEHLRRIYGFHRGTQGQPAFFALTLCSVLFPLERPVTRRQPMAHGQRKYLINREHVPHKRQYLPSSIHCPNQWTWRRLHGCQSL